MIRLAALLLAFPAWADGISLSGTPVVLQPSPDAMAEVVIDNRLVNGPHDNGQYLLTLDGMEVWIGFRWNGGTLGDDTLTVTPPDGVACIPACMIDVPEGTTGRVLLIEWEGM